MVSREKMASSFIIIFCVAHTSVELVLSRDIRRPDEVCNSRNMMLSIIRAARMGLKEDGNMSEHANDSSVGDIFTKLIQHVEANSKTEPESFVEMSRALRAEVRRLKACLPTEDEHPNKSESGK